MPPNQNVRNLIAKMKLVPVFELIHGKKFVLVDDSIVRGTQLRETVSYLIDNGAEKIHVKDGKADNDVTWSGLEKGKTYYVAETDAQGNVITASDTSSLNVNGYKFETAGSTLGAQTVQVASTGDAAAT